MKAYIIKAYGDASAAELTEFSEPQLCPHDLRIEVAGMGLNPVDYKTRDGLLKAIYSPTLPIVMGNELSGVVSECGTEVKNFKVGDKIVARVEKDRLGAFAEQVCINEEVATFAPKSIPLGDAAALPLAALTAIQALRDELGASAGKHILITGGAGGVGTFAIQIAKYLGAEVTTTASPRGEALVREMGADHVIDYTKTDLADVTTKFDGVFDLIGGDTLKACFGLAKSGATVVSISGTPEPVTASKDLQAGLKLKVIFWLVSFGLRRMAAKFGVTYRYLFMHASGSELAELVQMVDDGQLKIIIDKKFDFADIAEAMAYLEAGRAKGKVIVNIDKT
ncbi:MAG: NADP-dependent oxidoreductase [Alphaproteobacteria bacterium]|nr:NADP-dependent oxidoreductase [Alphaproteobacteria bacterium]